VLIACQSPRLAPLGPGLELQARLLRIEDTRVDEPAWLDSLLAAGDARVRAAAAITAGRLGALTHRAALRRLVADPDRAVAASSLFALGLMKDSASAPDAARALRRTHTVAAEAAWLLGQVGERGHPALLAAAHDSMLPVSTRSASIVALWRSRPAVVGPLLPLLTHRDSAIAWSAAYVLARGRSPSAVRALIASTRSPWAGVRDHAARGLGRALAGDTLGDLAVLALSRLTSDTSPLVRITALRGLATYERRATTARVAAMRDPDPGVRLVATASASLAFGSDAAQWTHAWSSDTSFVIRRALADAAVAQGLRLSLWHAWRTSPEWQHRAAAAELDAVGPATTAIQTTDAPLRDRDGRVRAAAAGALGRLADSVATRDEARRRLSALLQDPDVGVRTSALEALANGATMDDLARALPAYVRSTAGSELEARLAFWSLADSALSRGGAMMPDSVEASLRQLPRPGDPLERSRAARVARFAQWRDSSSVAHPLDWYRARAREMRRVQPLIARVVTDRGPMELELYAADAPLTVYNFVSLARRGYFDGLRFHRVVPNFVVQGGDPAEMAMAAPGTRFATRSTAAATAEVRSAWRSRDRTPAVASSS
jgi:HEAT repeat protein